MFSSELSAQHTATCWRYSGNTWSMMLPPHLTPRLGVLLKSVSHPKHTEDWNPPGLYSIYYVSIRASVIYLYILTEIFQLVNYPVL